MLFRSPTLKHDGCTPIAVFSYRQVEHCLRGSYGSFEHVGAGIWLRICALIDIDGFEGNEYPRETQTRKQSGTNAWEVRSDHGHLHGAVLDVIHSVQLAVCEELSQAWLRDYVQVLTPSIVRLGLGLGEDDEVEYNF